MPRVRGRGGWLGVRRGQHPRYVASGIIHLVGVGAGADAHVPMCGLWIQHEGERYGNQR